MLWHEDDERGNSKNAKAKKKKSLRAEGMLLYLNRGKERTKT